MDTQGEEFVLVSQSLGLYHNLRRNAKTKIWEVWQGRPLRDRLFKPRWGV